MKYGKKVMAAVLTSAMALSVLSGCSSSPKPDSGTAAGQEANTEAKDAGETKVSSGESVTIRLWGGVPAEAGPQTVCDNFNETYKDKGIQVEYERFVNDDTGNLKLETNLLSGTGVDLYMAYSTDALEKRAGGNMALDLSELIARDGFELEKYFGDMAKAYYVNGKPYSIPTKLDQYGIVLNKDMFDAAGIEIPTEWTYEEFREIAKKLTHGEGQDKVYGMFWNSQQDLTSLFTYLVSQTNGGDTLYVSETETSFADPVVLKSVELLNNMMNVDHTSPTHTDSVTQKLSQEGMFLTGKTAMTIGPWMVRSIKDTATYPHDFTTAFAPYPVVEEGQRNYTQGGYGDHLCINPKSENIEAAWEFAKWYATEGMIPVVEGGRIPAANTYDPEEVAKAFLKGAEDHIDVDTAMKILITPVDNYAVPSITNHIAEVRKVVTEELENIYIGQQTVEDGMAKAKERADALLK
ncbi:ABC transporter substrate-binding protein [Hungatella hathewayi]|uniref:ABC transporter substrate-binding protein n=1 Tax=Hungatella hathewayi TaxID=154046 RepID=UPI003567951C